MKKILIAIGYLLFLVSVAVAAQLKPYPFPFIGKWMPAEDPLLIEDYGLQDIQNMRKSGKHFKGVSGHTKINTTAWHGTNEYPRNGYHFRKGQPAESHVLITATESDGSNPIIYQNTTAIPSAGNFSGTVLFTEDTDAALGRFAAAPQGNVVYCNGEESLIWGGDELTVGGFEVFDPEGSFSYNYWEKVRNTSTDSDNLAVITPADATLDSYVKLLLHCDGADGTSEFTDSSTATTKTVTAVADAQIDTSYKKFGTASGLFDGTGDLLTVPDHADWTLGTTEFSIDTWIKLKTLTADAGIVSQTTDDGNYWEWEVETDGTLKWFYLLGTSSENTIETLTGSGEIVAGTEYHIAVTRDSSGNVFQYIDGELRAGVAAGTAEIANLTGELVLGATAYNGTSEFLDGALDEFRFTVGTSRYGWAHFQPPITAYSGSGVSSMLIGSPRQLQGFKIYVETANTADPSTMGVSCWDGSSWVGVASLVDGTNSGTISLAQTGAVTFTSTVATAKKSIHNGIEYYWYTVQISDCDSTTTVSYVTLNAPMQAMTNIWDTSMVPTAKCYLYTTEYKDYTDEIQDTTSSYFAELDSLGTTGYLLGGYLDRQQGFDISLVAGETNSNASVLTVSYWNGSEWTETGNTTDGTSDDGKSLGKSGVITFQPISVISEFQREIQQEIPLFWYKLSWSASLDASVQIYNIQGIPVSDTIRGYKFPAMFQNRTWLFCDNSGDKSKAIYSAYNSPHVFNGSDSGFLYFGNDEELTAAVGIYNLYRTSGVEQLIITKRYETYRLFGSGPSDFGVQQLSSTIGCIAPLSMAVCPLSDIGEADLNRQVVVFQSASGVIMSDGASLITISNDIDNYWDANSDDFIPTDRQDDSVGWYDPALDCYKLLVSSGSGQATHNVELEYSLKYNEWTKIYREDGSGANPLQVGFLVSDTTGNSYSFGCNNSAYMYRLENGNKWGSTAIAQYLHTKDIMMDNETPLFSHTLVEYFRLLYKTKTTGTGKISIDHYCDGVITTDGSLDQHVPDDIDITAKNINTQDCALGPCLKHSFKLSIDTDDMPDGMEPTGMGFYYSPLQTIQID